MKLHIQKHYKYIIHEVIGHTVPRFFFSLSARKRTRFVCEMETNTHNGFVYIFSTHVRKYPFHVSYTSRFIMRCCCCLFFFLHFFFRQNRAGPYNMHRHTRRMYLAYVAIFNIPISFASVEFHIVASTCDNGQRHISIFNVCAILVFGECNHGTGDRNSLFNIFQFIIIIANNERSGESLCERRKRYERRRRQKERKISHFVFNNNKKRYIFPIAMPTMHIHSINNIYRLFGRYYREFVSFSLSMVAT